MSPQLQRVLIMSAALMCLIGLIVSIGALQSVVHSIVSLRFLPELPKDFGYQFWKYVKIAGLLVLIGLLVAAFVRWQFVKEEVVARADALRGAAFELVKLMENAGPGGAESRATKAEGTAERFAVNGAATVAAAEKPPAMIGTASHIDRGLTAVGDELLKFYRTDSAKFRKGRGQVRTGAMIFLTLVGQKNLNAARMMMIDYIREQMNEPLNSMPNYALLKRFFNMPDDWPQEVPPRKWDFWDEQKSKMALGRVRKQVFDGISYRTPALDGKPAVLARNHNVIAAVREFIRSDDTAKAFE